MLEMAPEFVPHLVGVGCSAAVIDQATRIMAAVPDNTFKQILQCLVTFDRYTDFERIAQPCCLIAGETDSNAPLATMRKMAARLPGSEFHEIPDCGHLVLQESAGQCNSLIQAFLSQAEARSQDST